MKYTLWEALCECEVALGENLQWLTDKLDLHVRQGDPETLHKLKQLNDAWVKAVKALHTQ